jgi:phage gp36-like protein
MAYVTPNEIRSIVARDEGQYDSTAASLSEAQLEEAIDSATNEVEARLSGQYIVPFSQPPDTPPLVAEIVRDIAAWLADLTYRQDTDYETGNEPMLLRYQRALDLLSRLELGTLTLPGADTPEVPSAGSGTGRPINPYEGDMFTLRDFDLGYERYRSSWPR